MMRICIVGAGSIGGLFGTRLAAAKNCELSVLGRGNTLAALRKEGWRLKRNGKTAQFTVRAEERAEDLGPQDIVIVAVKSHMLPVVAPAVAALCANDGWVMPAMNGIPWWFGQGTDLGDKPLESTDPGGGIGTLIPVSRVIGCVVHASAFCPEPALVEHVMGNEVIIGEPLGGLSDRVEMVATLFRGADFDVTTSRNIRQDIWYKLWGNMTMNPVSALTGATTDRILADPLVRAFCSDVMEEAASIGKCIGCSIAQSPEERHAVTARLGAFKTSMLQDVEAGRSIELDPIIAAVCEIGARLQVPTPKANILLGLTRLFARVHSLYPQDHAPL